MASVGGKQRVGPVTRDRNSWEASQRTERKTPLSSHDDPSGQSNAAYNGPLRFHNRPQRAWGLPQIGRLVLSLVTRFSVSSQPLGSQMLFLAGRDEAQQSQKTQ